MNQQKLIKALQTIPLFQEINPEHFEKLKEIASLVEVEARQELFREGDPEDYLYIVIQGRVAIEMQFPSRGRVRIYTAEPLDFVGWSSVTPVVRSRTAGAVAVLPSCLVRFDASALRQEKGGDRREQDGMEGERAQHVGAQGQRPPAGIMFPHCHDSEAKAAVCPAKDSGRALPSLCSGPCHCHDNRRAGVMPSGPARRLARTPRPR